MEQEANAIGCLQNAASRLEGMMKSTNKLIALYGAIGDQEKVALYTQERQEMAKRLALLDQVTRCEQDGIDFDVDDVVKRLRL